MSWLPAMLLAGLVAAEASAYPTFCECGRLRGGGDPLALVRVDRCERRLQAAAARRCRQRARPTHSVAMTGNLSLDAGLTKAGFDGRNFATAFASSNFAMSMSVVDATGQTHDLLLFFTREADGRRWQVHFGVDAEETGGSAGQLQLLGDGGSLRFDETGVLRVARGLHATVVFKDAPIQGIRLDASSMTARPGPTGVSCMSQDGCAG